MHRQRLTQFCRYCQSKVIFAWREPPHHLHSTMTLCLIGGQFVTPLTGGLMIMLWLQRIASSTERACPHCQHAI